MKIAVYPVSKFYYDTVIPSVKSLLLHSDVDEIYLTAETTKFPYDLPKCVKTLNAKTLKKAYLYGDNLKKSPYAYLTLLRCAYPEIFDADKMLSLDADTIIRAEIGSDPWEMDLQGCYIAGVAEQKLSRKKRRPYINAGVMIMDLAKMRQDGQAETLLNAINEKEYYWLEQDCINDVFRDHIRILPKIWNASQFTGISKKTLIRHYAQEDFKASDEYKYYSSLSWEDVLKERC